MRFLNYFWGIIFLSTIAVSGNAANVASLEQSKEISYTIDVGDVTGLSEASLVELINEAVSSIPSINEAKKPQCSISGTVKVSIFGQEVTLTLTATDDCDKVAATFAQLVKDTAKECSTLLP